MCFFLEGTPPHDRIYCLTFSQGIEFTSFVLVTATRPRDGDETALQAFNDGVTYVIPSK